MAGLDNDLEDPRILQLEELMRNPSLFPPIHNPSFGKETNSLIKSLLSNFQEGGNKSNTNS